LINEYKLVPAGSHKFFTVKLHQLQYDIIPSETENYAL